MTTTANMLLVLPTLGGSSGTWDDLSQAIHERIDVHDHATGKGVKIKPAGIDINADLTFAGLWAPTNLKAVQFTAQAAYTVARSLFVLSADNELYWRTNAGVNVKVTSGSSLNLSLVGGIYGDYSTTAAKVYYEDAGKRYKMLQSGPAPDFWASVDCGDLKLYEKASGIANAVTLKSPAALTAGYSLTMGPALPASVATVQVSAAGVLTYALVAKHGDKELTISAVSGGSAAGSIGLTANGQARANAGAARWAVPIVGIPVGARIRSISHHYTRAGGTLTFRLWRWNMPASSLVQVGTTKTDAASGGTVQKLTDAGIDHVVLTDNLYYADFVSGANLDDYYGISVTYDQP